MNLSTHSTLLTILQEGSITAAAKKLFISQPSLSQVVKLAETNLGAPVFNRSTDPISLTPAGGKIRGGRQADPRHPAESGKGNRGNKDGGARKNPVRHSGPEGDAASAPGSPSFFEKYPHVDIEILEQGSSRMEDLVLNGSVDLACMTTVARREELSYHLLESEELVLLAAGTTDLAKRIPKRNPHLHHRGRTRAFYLQ